MAQLLGGEGSDRFVLYQHQQLHPYDLSSIYFLLQQLNVTSGEDQQQYEILKGHLNSHSALDRTASECIHLLPRKGVNTQVLVGEMTPIILSLVFLHQQQKQEWESDCWNCG